MTPQTHFQLAEWLSLIPNLVNYAIDFLNVAALGLSLCENCLFAHLHVNVSNLVHFEQIYNCLSVWSIRLVSSRANVQNYLERIKDEVNVRWQECCSTGHFHRWEFFSWNVGITDVVYLGVEDRQHFFGTKVVNLEVKKVDVIQVHACSCYLNRWRNDGRFKHAVDIHS